MSQDAVDIQDRLDSSREQLLRLIETLPDEALLTPKAVGEYSVADLLAQFTSWEAELITGLMRVDQGKKPERLLKALEKPDAYNEKRRAENSGRDLDLIFDDFQRVRMQLETWLEAFSDRDLSDPKRFRWLEGKSLAQLIAETTFVNEEKYLSELKSFTSSWNVASKTG